MPSSHLILCRPLLLLPPIPPSIRVFYNESTLRIRWPKYWSFSFNMSPSNEHPGLISFRMDWLDLLAVQGILKSSPTSQFESINHSPLLLQYKNARLRGGHLFLGSVHPTRKGIISPPVSFALPIPGVWETQLFFFFFKMFIYFFGGSAHIRD